MSLSKLHLFNHFANIRIQPKLIIKLFLTLIIIVTYTFVSGLSVDYKKLLSEAGLSETSLAQIKIFSQISIFFSRVFSVLFTFLIILVISRIMRSDANTKSIFSATLSYILFTNAISLIILTIQISAGLSLIDYSITSLNIFAKGNRILGTFDLQFFVQAYILTVMLIGTSKLSIRASTIWGIIYLILIITFSLISISIQ
ncbi:TPA: hypothetical protein ACNSBE_000141 [Staphylococcus aureus]